MFIEPRDHKSAYDTYILHASLYVCSKLCTLSEYPTIKFVGPAGTGKTESVKALGHQLGRFVLVFNCDEIFDFQAMGCIFVGLCQVGA